MKTRTILMALGPGAFAVGAIAYFNPAILTRPVVTALSLVIGGVGAIAAHILEN